jgi:hypothetical protein
MHSIHKARGGFSCFCPICIKHLDDNKNQEDTLNKIPDALLKTKKILNNDKVFDDCIPSEK